jgi:hypothetical protein
MTLFRAATLVLASSVFIAGCGDGGDVNNELSFRVIHASPDSPPVNILVDGVAFRSGVDYKGGTGFTFVTPRTYRFGIEAILPGEDALIIDQSVPLVAGSEFTVLALGKDATDTVHTLIIENNFEEIPDGNARVQFVHAAPDAPVLDVYLTAEGASLPAATPVITVTYDEYPADRQLIAPGDYVLRVTPEGDPNTVLFDSGPLGTLGNRADLLFVLVENTAAGSSPLSLVINNGFSSFELLDRATPAQLRVVHLSPDAPALDVIGSPVTTTFPEVPFSSADNLAGIALDSANNRALVVDNRQGAVVAVNLQTGARSILSPASAANGIAYLGNTGYVTVAPDSYSVRGEKTAAPNGTAPLFTSSAALAVGRRATVFADGLLASIIGQVSIDDSRPVFAEGKLRFLHAAPAGGTVDLYVLEAGTPIADEEPTFSNLVLTSLAGHFGFVPGNYTITFTKADTKEVVAVQNVAAPGSTAQTVILVDEVRVDGTSDGKPAAVLVLDDLAD